MRIKETEQEKIIRYLKRDSLEEVREVYFNTVWDSYKELVTYFKKAGWSRTELIKADRPRGRGDERYEKRILYWYLLGKPDYYDPIPDDVLKEFEQTIQNNLPTIVTTRHGSYMSEILYNPTFKRLLRCVKESIYVNKDPDHCGIASLPEITLCNDGGPNRDIQYQVITFCMDS
jgi:hypothetical protein